MISSLKKYVTVIFVILACVNITFGRYAKSAKQFKCQKQLTVTNCKDDDNHHYFNLTSGRCHYGCTDGGDLYDFRSVAVCLYTCDVTRQELIEDSYYEAECVQDVPVITCPPHYVGDHYYYDLTTKTCKLGCKHRKMDFRSLEDCEVTCRIAKQTLQPRNFQPAIPYEDANWAANLFEQYQPPDQPNK